MVRKTQVPAGTGSGRNWKKVPARTSGWNRFIKLYMVICYFVWALPDSQTLSVIKERARKC